MALPAASNTQGGHQQQLKGWHKHVLKRQLQQQQQQQQQKEQEEGDTVTGEEDKATATPTAPPPTLPPSAVVGHMAAAGGVLVDAWLTQHERWGWDMESALDLGEQGMR
jgi:DNA topoisomerase IA